jgi:MPBQ/MSBQ methyltransferase
MALCFDVACGATTQYLTRYFESPRVIGINISKKQLQSCRTNAPQCKFLLMSATELGFRDNCIENVICVEAAFHFDTRERFLAEVLRVLKAGGRLVLSDILRNKNYDHRHRRLHPVPNYVSGLEDYRTLYVCLGFENVSVIDVTPQCWGGFARFRLQSVRRAWLNGEIETDVFKRTLRRCGGVLGVGAIRRHRQV